MLRLVVYVLTIFSVPAFAGEAPDFSIHTRTIDGRLSDLKNQVVYLDFWASWCSPCRQSFPWMNALQRKYADQGLVVIAINVDREKILADEFLKQVPAEFPIIFDHKGKIARAYEVMGMPSSYLIDREGEIRQVHTGFYENKLETYEAELKALLAEKIEKPEV